MQNPSFNLNRQQALPRAKGVALHRQLYLVLIDRIKRGEWPTGSALPTEAALCDQFGVSRITVRRALSDLEADGMVERRHGLGTFTLSDTAELRPQATLSFIDGLRKQAEETRVRVLHVNHGVPPDDIAGLLRLAPGESAFHAVRLRVIDDVPVMLTEAWVPDRIASRITAAALGKHPLYKILIRQGVQFGRVVQEISAEAAGPQHALHLGTHVGAPLVKLVRLMHDQAARPVLHLAGAIPPDRGRVLMDIPASELNTLSAGYISHGT